MVDTAASPDLDITQEIIQHLEVHQDRTTIDHPAHQEALVEVACREALAECPEEVQVVEELALEDPEEVEGGINPPFFSAKV